MSQHTGSGDQSPYLPPLSSIFGDKPGLYTYLSFQFLFPHDLPPSRCGLQRARQGGGEVPKFQPPFQSRDISGAFGPQGGRKAVGPHTGSWGSYLLTILASASSCQIEELRTILTSSLERAVGG